MLRAGGAERKAVLGAGLGTRGAQGSLAGVQWPVAGGGARGKEYPFLAVPHAACSRHAIQRVGRLRGQCPGSALLGRAAAADSGRSASLRGRGRGSSGGCASDRGGKRRRGKVAELRPHPLLQSPPSPRPCPSWVRPLGSPRLEPGHWG